MNKITSVHFIRPLSPPKILNMRAEGQVHHFSTERTFVKSIYFDKNNSDIIIIKIEMENGDKANIGVHISNISYWEFEKVEAQTNCVESEETTSSPG